MAKVQTSGATLGDLSPDICEFADRFSRHARRWLRIGPLFQVARQARPQGNADPVWRTDMKHMFDECTWHERDAWRAVEIHLADAGWRIIGELEDYSQRLPHMTASDRRCLFEIRDISGGQLPRAETLEFLQLSVDDVARIAARSTSRGL